MTRTSLVILLAASMTATVGCASKNYVKQETTPLINKTNELDDLTAKNTREIKDVDARAQSGIQAVNAKTAEVDQKAQAAGQNATSAQQMADTANNRVGVLTNTVVNLDNYRVQSPLFTLTAAQDNAFGIPAGKTKSVAEGFWILLAPLSAGRHTIQFHGEAVFGTFTFEEGVTYNLTVR